MIIENKNRMPEFGRESPVRIARLFFPRRDGQRGEGISHPTWLLSVLCARARRQGRAQLIGVIVEEVEETCQAARQDPQAHSASTRWLRRWGGPSSTRQRASGLR